jgi:hypothetical protein
MQGEMTYRLPFFFVASTDIGRRAASVNRSQLRSILL